jgi:hypothetical protein
MINGLDAAAQILMYSYSLVQSERVRHYIQLAKIILGLANVWDDWSTAELIKSVISQFLEQHPIPEEPASSFSSSSSSSGSSCGSANPSPFAPGYDDNHINIQNILASDTLFPMLQQPTFPVELLSVNNSHLDLMNSPWLTGNEPWLQTINDNLFSEQQSLFIQEQEQQQQQQQQQQQLFMNQIEFSAMFDNIV